MVRLSETLAQTEAQEYVSVHDPLTEKDILIPRERLWEFEDAMHWVPVDNENVDGIGES